MQVPITLYKTYNLHNSNYSVTISILLRFIIKFRISGLVRNNTFYSSRMNNKERDAESDLYSDWFANNGYNVIRPPNNLRFEGSHFYFIRISRETSV